MKSIHQLGPLTLTLCGADRPSSVCCFLLPAAVPENLAEIGENQDAAFLFLTGMDWNHDLSPCPPRDSSPGRTLPEKGRIFSAGCGKKSSPMQRISCRYGIRFVFSAAFPWEVSFRSGPPQKVFPWTA